MLDELFDRSYRSGGAELNAGLDRGFRRIGKAVSTSFEALHRIQFAAPWNKRSNTRCA